MSTQLKNGIQDKESDRQTKGRLMEKDKPNLGEHMNEFHEDTKNEMKVRNQLRY
jgi:hypothetical protein